MDFVFEDNRQIPDIIGIDKWLNPIAGVFPAGHAVPFLYCSSWISAEWASSKSHPIRQRVLGLKTQCRLGFGFCDKVEH